MTVFMIIHKSVSRALQRIPLLRFTTFKKWPYSVTWPRTARFAARFSEPNSVMQRGRFMQTRLREGNAGWPAACTPQGE